ncbi:MAG: hypothetical protein ACI9XJ_002384 [Marivirga sp.]|jgi:hypothetical protein
MHIGIFYVNNIFNRIDDLVNYLKIVIAYLLLFQTAYLYGQTYQSLYKAGLAAYEAGQDTVFLEKIQYANELRIDHQTIMYQLAIALVLDGQLDSSCYYLSKVIEINAINYDLSAMELQKLKGLAAFQEIIRRQRFLKTPYLLADTAQLINDASMHIQNVAFDSIKRMFVLSSINKGNLFWLETTGVLLPVLDLPLPVSPTGMAVNSQANIWLAAMGVVEEGLAPADGQLNKAFLYKIDLTTSSILKSFQVKDEKPHLFGDVFVSGEGVV